MAPVLYRATTFYFVECDWPFERCRGYDFKNTFDTLCIICKARHNELVNRVLNWPHRFIGDMYRLQGSISKKDQRWCCGGGNEVCTRRAVGRSENSEEGVGVISKDGHNQPLVEIGLTIESSHWVN